MILTSGHPALVNGKPQKDEEAPSTELAIKDNVRIRDGFKCRDCGMTQDEHLEKFGRILDVHRVLPGIVYREESCVTLCRDCHGKKPRRTGEAFWAKDLLWIGINLYDRKDRILFDELFFFAKKMGCSLEVLI